MCTSQWTHKQMTFIDSNPQNETTINKGNGLCWKERMAIKGEFFPIKKKKKMALGFPHFVLQEKGRLAWKFNIFQRADT